jgi:Pvc16 N-terminal domain
VIHEVDEALRRLVERELDGSGVEISFEAPTRDWAARRSAPTVDLYLYDIREDRLRRNVAREPVRDDAGIIVGRRKPPRMFKLSYLVTAWTQRPEDEHRLLSTVLACALRYDALPRDILSGSLSEQPLNMPITVALPPPEDRALSDVWTALGGELKPSLDLVITAPVDSKSEEVAGKPVLEEPRISIAGEEPNGKRRRRGGPREKAPEERPRADEVVHAGTEAQPGRTFRVRDAR